MLDAYYHTVDAANEVNNMLMEAIRSGSANRIATLISIHSRAVQAQFDAEKLYREEQERRKVLIPLADAKAMVNTTFETIIRRLEAMPQKLAGILSKETDPLRVLDILTREMRDIREEAARANAFR